MSMQKRVKALFSTAPIYKTNERPVWRFAGEGGSTVHKPARPSASLTWDEGRAADSGEI